MVAQVRHDGQCVRIANGTVFGNNRVGVDSSVPMDAICDMQRVSLVVGYSMDMYGVVGTIGIIVDLWVEVVVECTIDIDGLEVGIG